jgi:hypothetical protein
MIVIGDDDHISMVENRNCLKPPASQYKHKSREINWALSTKTRYFSAYINPKFTNAGKVFQIPN